MDFIAMPGLTIPGQTIRTHVLDHDRQQAHLAVVVVGICLLIVGIGARSCR